MIPFRHNLNLKINYCSKPEFALLKKLINYYSLLVCASSKLQSPWSELPLPSS